MDPIFYTASNLVSHPSALTAQKFLRTQYKKFGKSYSQPRPIKSWQTLYHVKNDFPV